MIEILHFIFSSFWVWLGTLALLLAIINGIVSIIQEFHTRKRPIGESLLVTGDEFESMLDALKNDRKP